MRRQDNFIDAGHNSEHSTILNQVALDASLCKLLRSSVAIVGWCRLQYDEFKFNRLSCLLEELTHRPGVAKR